ncbi:MAG: hypothetical protein KDK78_12455, partial [Chlamydiia bacterium]|nr:hypothetical protein [Chlamydiia bacterium]
FDLLPFADRVGVLQYPRKQCFAPLKNATGLDSPETVRASLLAMGEGEELEPLEYYPCAVLALA